MKLIREMNSGALFFLFFAIGIAVIFYLKGGDYDVTNSIYELVLVVGGPVVVLVVYAIVEKWVATDNDISDDQTGDNCYYLGFLFTLTSLGVSFFVFSGDISESSNELLQNFGIAVASTIFGIVLRVLFQQSKDAFVADNVGDQEEILAKKIAKVAKKLVSELESSSGSLSTFRKENEKLTTILKQFNDGLGNISSPSEFFQGKFTDINKHLADIAGNLKVSNDNMITAINSKIDEEIVLLQHIGDMIKNSTQGQFSANFETKLENQLNDLSKAIAESSRLLNQQSGLMDAIVASTQKFESVRTVADQVEKITTTLTALNDNVNAINSQANSVVSSMKSIESIGEETKRVNKALEVIVLILRKLKFRNIKVRFSLFSRLMGRRKKYMKENTDE